MKQQRYVMKGAHKEMRGLAYLVYSAVSLSLLLAMVLLPLAPAFADESEATNESETVNAPAESVETIIDDASDSDTEDQNDDSQSHEEDTDVEIIISEEIDEHVSENDLVVNTDTTNDTVVEETVNDVLNAESAVTEGAEVVQDVTPVIDDAAGEVVVDNEEGEDTPSIEIIDENQVDKENIDVVETEDDTIPENVDDSETSTESESDSSENVVVVNTLTNDDNKFSFSESECTTVGDGTFYCAKAKEEATPTQTDRIFSAPDGDGDKEIYIEKEGEIGALTSNTEDDDAPYYDEGSDTVVWHRLIDGRYQIIAYDFDEEKETQLTHDRYNNMEPSRFGNTIVWQGWVGNDWEIFMLVDDELTMLTDNATHDIAPSVNGTHVVWRAFENDMWRMKVYDMRTKHIDTVDDVEGGSIENPRFVLVYDTRHDTGDIETKGYDLKSGEVVHLASEPTSLPDEIPDPDQTGEERALVNVVTQLKPKTEDEGGDEPLPEATGTSTPNNTDVVVPPIDDSASATTDITDDSTTTSTTTDLVISSVTTEETRDTSHIGDIIVTPYIEPIATSTDAQ